MDISILRDEEKTWPDFNEYKVVTATGIAYFQQDLEISLKEVYDSIDVIEVEYKIGKMNVEKNIWKINFKGGGKPGDILCVRYDGEAKGPICPIKTKGVLELKMSMSDKNYVHVKLSKQSFHVTGAYGSYHIEEVAQHLNKLFNTNITIKNIDMVMINKKFNLGFEINRSNLNTFIRNDGEFGSTFSRHGRKEVKIVKESHRIRKNKQVKHIFKVYATGKVTQIGSDLNEMQQVYERFRTKIEQNKHYFIETLI